MHGFSSWITLMNSLTDSFDELFMDSFDELFMDSFDELFMDSFHGFS